MLPTHKNNYLCSVFIYEKSAGIAYADISTGEFAATEIEGKDIVNLVHDELVRLNPAEIIWPDSIAAPSTLPGPVTTYESWHFDTGRCIDLLKEHFHVTSLEGFGLAGMNLAIRAAGAILQYVDQTSHKSKDLLSSINTYHTHDFMVLDSQTRRNLELVETIRTGKPEGSLLDILDCTSTAMGKRLLRNWVSKPLLKISAIDHKLDLVELFFGNGNLRSEMADVLLQLNDTERTINRIVSGHAMPYELVGLRSDLSIIPLLLTTLPGNNPILNDLIQKIDPCADQLELLNAALSEDPPKTLANTGIIRPGYSPELDNIISASQHAR
jgi:DNA mismatch repair protein MutS